MEALWQDLRYAARGFRRNPTFTLTAILAITLGVGATTAVYSVVDRILFRSLPYRAAERLVSVGLVAPIEPQEFMLGADYVEWRTRQTPFESLTSMGGTRGCDLSDQNPLRLSCAEVESNFLTTFGVTPALGRNFTEDEDKPGATPVVLLSYGLWQSRFAADPAIVGQSIPLDGRPTTVIGILPRDFELPNLARPDALVPLALDLARQQRPNTGRVLRSFARLQPGVNVEQAVAALQPLFADSLQWVPAPFRKEVRLSVRSLRDRQVQDVRLASWTLLAAVLAVLMIACANVANLLLARGLARRQELAIRAALGAARGRLMRQQLVEGVLLALLGGAPGCLLAFGLLRLFVVIAPEGIARLQQAELDGRVLLFALAVTVISGLLFGLASVRRSGPELLVGQRAVGYAPSLMRKLLVVAQVGVSFVLLAGAGLLLRSLVNLQQTALGLETEGVVTTGVVLGRYAYPEPAQQMEFYERLEARLKTLPGVTAVALSDSLPPAGQMRGVLYATIEVAGRPRSPEGTGGMVPWRSVTPGYFSALRIPIVRGRGFREEDRMPSENAVVLSRSLASLLFPNEEALGKQLRFGLQGPWYSVVGVAGDVKNAGLTAASDPEFYLVRKNSPSSALNSSTAIVRTSLPAATVAGWMRLEIAAIDPALPVNIQTMSQRVGLLRQKPRFNATLLGIFATIGVALTVIGVYGVLAFLVAERTREFGVRMALGGAPGDILRLVLSRGLRLAAVGIVLGAGASLAAGRLLRGLLFGVSETDVLTQVAVVLVLSSAMLAGSYLPARRAMRVDPAVALRHE